MPTKTIINKLTENKRDIFITLGYFVIFRSVIGFSILAIAYFAGVEIKEVRDIEVFGVKIYLILLPLIIFSVGRRLYKIRRWWISK